MSKGCFNCVRMFLFVLNFLFLVIGLALIGSCLYIRLEPTTSSVYDSFGLKLDITFYVAIAIGAVTVIISVFGCCGAYCLSSCNLTAYFICLLVIVVLESAGAAYVFVNREDDQMRQSLSDKIKSDVVNATSPAEVPEYVVALQKALACCGATGSTDYSSNSTAAAVCEKEMKEGCVDKVYTLVNENAKFLLIAVGGIAFLEVVSLLLSLYACCFLRNNPEYVSVAVE